MKIASGRSISAGFTWPIAVVPLRPVANLIRTTKAMSLLMVIVIRSATRRPRPRNTKPSQTHWQHWTRFKSESDFDLTASYLCLPVVTVRLSPW